MGSDANGSDASFRDSDGGEKCREQMKTRILLAECRHLLREGLRALIEREQDFLVVAEASDDVRLDELVRGSRPDVAVIGDCPGPTSGVSAMRRIAREFPSTRIVGLCFDSSLEAARGMVEAGASALVGGGCAFRDLARAIRGVRFPGRAQVAQRGASKAPAAKEGGAGAVLDRLTSREREVMQLLAAGLKTRQIGERLFISVKTVETHRSNLMRKLQVSSVAELTKVAIRAGLTPL